MRLFDRLRKELKAEARQTFKYEVSSWMEDITRHWTSDGVRGIEIQKKYNTKRGEDFDWREGFEAPVGIYLLKKIVDAIRPTIDAEIEKSTSDMYRRIESARDDARGIALAEVSALLEHFRKEDFIDDVVERIKRKQLNV